MWDLACFVCGSKSAIYIFLSTVYENQVRFGAIAWALWLLGCGASYSDGHFVEGNKRFDVGAPGPGWARLDAGNNAIAWTNAQSNAVIQVNASCKPELDIPLGALTNQLLIGFTERTDETREVVPFDSREAMRTSLTAKLDGVTRKMLLVVMKKDGCVYDMSLLGEPAHFDAAAPVFEQVLQSFHAPTRTP